MLQPETHKGAEAKPIPSGEIAKFPAWLVKLRGGLTMNMDINEVHEDDSMKDDKGTEALFELADRLNLE
jgi:hypothetical protein